MAIKSLITHGTTDGFSALAPAFSDSVLVQLSPNTPASVAIPAGADIAMIYGSDPAAVLGGVDTPLSLTPGASTGTFEPGARYVRGNTTIELICAVANLVSITWYKLGRG